MASSQVSGSTAVFARRPLPRLCNLDRLLHAMKARDLDGIVASLPYNVFYLSILASETSHVDGRAVSRVRPTGMDLTSPDNSH